MEITEGIIVLILVVTIVFMVIVAPLWLILHYLSKARRVRGVSVQDREELTGLWEKASQMEQRVETLEEILDKEVPSWRKINEE